MLGRNLLDLMRQAPSILFYRVLARLVSKRNLVLVFAPASGNFAENSKYAWLELSKHEAIDLWFVTRNEAMAREINAEGVRAVSIESFFARWLALRCSVAVASGYHPFRGVLGRFLRGARSLQLWHGSGIKNVSLDGRNIAKQVASPLGAAALAVRGTFPVFGRMYFPSEDNFRRRHRSFRYREAALNGLLRNDLFFGKSFGDLELVGTDRSAAALMTRQRQEGRKLILLAPTWRGSDKPGFAERVSLDFEALNGLMARLDAFLVVKLHPSMRDRLDLAPYSHVAEYKRELDIYPLLPAFDMVISDFSSIASDFALTGKPIILYLPDLEEVLAKQRFSRSNLTSLPGELCLRPEGLCGTIERLLATSAEKPAGGRYDLTALHGFTDGRSCERFAADVLRDLGLPASPGSAKLAAPPNVSFAAVEIG